MQLLSVILPPLISAAAAIIVCLLTNRSAQKKIATESQKTADAAKKENDAVKKGVQALLRAQMIADWNNYSERGYAPIYAKENFENVWQQYHGLGVNGVMDDIHNKFLALPTEPPASTKGA